jgi:phosphatidylserine/phosphatidylglycerophosphate/cardiolipin synthase-like enzyme
VRHEARDESFTAAGRLFADRRMSGGSYNFTQAAQSKNAENVVVISGNRRVTDRFVGNFELQRGQSTPWR